MTASSRIEIYGSAGEPAEAPLLTGSYDGREYRLTIKAASGADGIGRWLSWEAGDEYRRQREDQQWHPQRRPES
jgi:hypothetical protein